MTTWNTFLELKDGDVVNNLIISCDALNVKFDKIGNLLIIKNSQQAREKKKSHQLNNARYNIPELSSYSKVND